MSPAENVTLLLCGSFNPVTNMHLRMFELARDFLHIRKICNVVSGLISPVHDGYKKEGLLPSEHRCEMVKKALQSSDWIKLDSWECEQESWKRTVEVLSYHQQQTPNNNNSEKIRVTLLCGADLLDSFTDRNLWQEQDIEDIVHNYGLVVITRDSCNPMRVINELDILYRHQGNIHVVTEWITNEVSATNIRRSLRRGESVKYLLQDPVIDYIRTNRLYGCEQDTKYPVIDLTPSPSCNVYPPPYAIVNSPDVHMRNIVNNNVLKVPVPTHRGGRSSNEGKVRSRNGKQRPPKMKRSESLV